MPDLDPAQEAGPAAEYRHLTSRTRQIPRSIIDSKWTPLDPASISVVDSLVADAARPVLLRLRDRDQRHAQAQTILHTFATRLRTKLVKGMPFPPPTISAAQAPSSRKTTRKRAQSGRSGYEAELDFEKTVDAIASLERALDPLLHSVVLLKAEKEREERELEREYKLLRQLEGNAKAERMGWRERGKRSHVLAGGLAGAGEKGGEGGLGLEVVKRQEGKGGAGGVFKDLQEEELLALSQQIGSHMESMRSNLAQIDGVLPAIAKTKAALQGALCQYMDPVQYDQVVLG
ncbi:hypothetical protein N656DRAFT_703156 [Canariomyces notabilis]|uniref:Uncharacterized protein n=1 Tax=Canariomyces notabilis TaxID=2074819 RepID=A0AAN6YVW5_9PEZI|nr:hypothetical protein N656DRAFT_703156 [Canariomyces arenarius]